jgi:hypothetical protein
MNRKKVAALVVLGFILSTGAVQAGSFPSMTSPSETIASPCGASILSPVSTPEGNEEALSKLLESLSQEPRPAGEQAWPGCWQCYSNAPCCSCDQETAIISCDDYCSCW